MYIAVSEFSYLGNIKTATNSSSFDKQHQTPCSLPKPFLQDISLFAKQNLFAVGLDSLTQVYQESLGILRGWWWECSKLQNKF